MFSDPFKVSLGLFQGDSVIVKSFSLYLAAALNQASAMITASNLPIYDSKIASDSQYADNCGFHNTDDAFLQVQKFFLLYFLLYKTIPEYSTASLSFYCLYQGS